MLKGPVEDDDKVYPIHPFWDRKFKVLLGATPRWLLAFLSLLAVLLFAGFGMGDAPMVNGDEYVSGAHDL